MELRVHIGKCLSYSAMEDTIEDKKKQTVVITDCVGFEFELHVIR